MNKTYQAVLNLKLNNKSVNNFELVYYKLNKITIVKL